MCDHGIALFYFELLSFQNHHTVTYWNTVSLKCNITLANFSQAKIITQASLQSTDN